MHTDGTANGDDKNTGPTPVQPTPPRDDFASMSPLIRQLATEEFQQDIQWTPLQNLRTSPSNSNAASNFHLVERENQSLDPVEVNAEHVGTIVNTHTGGRFALSPQPSLDPNDPLNWSTWHKYSTYITICCFTFLGQCNTSKFTIAIDPLVKEFKVSSAQAAYQVCLCILLLGIGNLFWVPLMRVIGKRPVYLLSMPILVAANVWSHFAHHFYELLGATILSGFAASAADATVPAVVADLFFVHERGAAMMIFSTATSCGLFIGPLINAYVVQYAGWRDSCTWIAVLTGAVWFVGVFTVRETSYHNRDIYAPETSFKEEKTFLEHLSITSGFNGEVSILKVFCDTLCVITYPGVLWSGLTVGVFVGMNLVVQLTSANKFPQLPYNFPTGSLGLLSISGFIGAIVAVFFGGRLIDVISNHVTKSHGGRREPEYRLYAMLIPSLIGPVGVLLFGLTLAEHIHWVAPAIGYGMQGFGLTAVSNVVCTYAVDSYLPLAGEALTNVFVLRGIIGTVLCLWLCPWIEHRGMKEAFGEMVGIEYFICLWTIVFLIWGKRVRAATAKYGPMSWGGYRR